MYSLRTRQRKMDKREEKQKWDDRHWTQKDLSQVEIRLRKTQLDFHFSF